MEILEKNLKGYKVVFNPSEWRYECPICHGKMRDRGTTTAYPSCKGLFMLERVKACDFCGMYVPSNILAERIRVIPQPSESFKRNECNINR